MAMNCFRCISRRFSSSGGKATVTDYPWLSSPLTQKGDNLCSDNASKKSQVQIGKTKISILTNGLKVASQESRGDFCTVGVGLNAGSRYEMFSPAGVTHFLEKLAFGSTSKFKSKDQILQKLAQHGGICDCQYSRDLAFFALSISKNSVETGLDILSEALLKPNITDQEVEMARSLVSFDLMDHDESLARMQPDILLHDMIHRAAFRGNTVGLPKFCPKEHLNLIARMDLESFLATYVQPGRTVIAGVGVDHDYLCSLVEKMFTFEDATFKSTAKLEVDESIAQYTGGELRAEKSLTPVTGGDNPLPELAHVVIGMESYPVSHKDYVPATVLSFIMGGGSSFSAGGPGKGMYSRMYLNILNRYYYVHHASAINFPYSDAGLMAIQLSCEPGRVSDTCRVAVQELLNMVETKTETEELERAKNQLKSMMFANLEAKPIQMEDIARQVLCQGFRREADEVSEMIDQVTSTDIIRVADNLLGSKISVAALGQIADVPSQRDITHAFNNNANFPYKKSNSI